MATIQEINALAMGQRNFASAVAPGNGSQTIVVSNGPSADGTCLPCEDASCEVVPTVATTFDNGSLRTATGTKVRFSVVSSQDDRHLDFFPNFSLGDETVYSLAYPGIGIITPNAYAAAGFLVNGIANAAPVAAFNRHLAGGYVVSKLTIQYTDDNNASGIVVTAFRFPAKPQDSVQLSDAYTPFCDACFTANNSGKVTNTYTINTGASFRSGIDLFVPATSTFTVELCLSIINLPNTQAAPAGTQML